MKPEAVVVIGVGLDGPASLSQRLQDQINQADELWGGERLLTMWPTFRGSKVVLGKKLGEELRKLLKRPSDKKIIVLASGDPGFFGVGASLLNVLPPEDVRLIPQPSVLQEAFATVKLPWNDAAFTSAHARPLTEVIGLVRRHPKLGILTDPNQTPAWIAEKLLAAKIADCRAIVLENMGGIDEKITESRLTLLPKQSFASLNVLILVQDPGWKPVRNTTIRPDDAYDHKKGLITKMDVRVTSISRLGLRETDLIWDIGAGSGAVSIEMAEIAWRGQVFAIEKDVECLACLHTNLERFGLSNIEIIPTAAPEGMIDLPAPDAVFIGGSDGKLEPILLFIEKSIRSTCRVVANFTLMENLLFAYHWMQDHGWQPELTEAQFSSGTPIGGGTRLAPANPVFILSGTCIAKRDK